MVDKTSGDILHEEINDKLKSFEEKQQKEDKDDGKRTRCLSYLVEEECITSEMANEVLFQKTGVPSVNLYTTQKIPENQQIEGEILDSFSKSYLLQHHCFPLRITEEKEENVVEVAIADPANKDSLLEIEDAITRVFSRDLMGNIKVKTKFLVCHISAIRNRLALAEI